MAMRKVKAKFKVVAEVNEKASHATTDSDSRLTREGFCLVFQVTCDITQKVQ